MNYQNPKQEHIRIVVGQDREKDPLERLRVVNKALRKLGCISKLDDPTRYRKIVGRNH